MNNTLVFFMFENVSRSVPGIEVILTHKGHRINYKKLNKLLFQKCTSKVNSTLHGNKSKVKKKIAKQYKNLSIQVEVGKKWK